MASNVVVKTSFRVGAWIAALAASTVLALNFERLAQAHRLDQLLPDPGRFHGLTAFAQRPIVVLTAALVLGFLLGLAAIKVKALIASRLVPTSDSGGALGARMLMCADNLSEMQRWTALHTNQDRRNALAVLNIIIVDAHRLGLHTPPPGSEPNDLLNYLTEVGSWLMKGDNEIARMRAEAISGANGVPGA